MVADPQVYASSILRNALRMSSSASAVVARGVLLLHSSGKHQRLHPSVTVGARFVVS